MKKRIALAFSMILMVLMLGACGTDPTAVDYNGHSYEELQNDSASNIMMVQQLAVLFTENDLTVDTVEKEIVESLQMNYGITDAQIEATAKWMNIEAEFGVYNETDDDSFSVVKSGNTLTSDVTLKFDKKDVDFQVVYDYYSMEITGLTVEPIYTLREKLQNAALNTVISISIVFAVLILISLLISCFKIFPYFEKKKAQKKAGAAVETTDHANDEIVSQIAQREQQQATDDTELVAVIAAAIAASTGTSTSDFVVRSINRR